MKALITGAAHGLGRAMTEQLLAKGHEVVAVDIDTGGLDELAVESKGACTVRLADMASPDSLERLIDGLGQARFDLVVLNAGISATGRFEDIPSAAYQKLIAVNLQAPLILASALIRNSLMARKSKLVFISSLSHAVGYPGASVYGATKSALAIYAASIRKPFKKMGVRVLTVFPGPIRTEHAERHAPPGAKASKRMDPEKLAKQILKVARGGATEFYPGSAATWVGRFGRMMPFFATRMMRRAIFDKLGGPTY